MISLLVMLSGRVTLSPAQGAEFTPGPSAGRRAQHLPWVWKGWCVQAVCKRAHLLPGNWSGAWRWGRPGEMCHCNRDKERRELKKQISKKTAWKIWLNGHPLGDEGNRSDAINFMGQALQSEQCHCFHSDLYISLAHHSKQEMWHQALCHKSYPRMFSDISNFYYLFPPLLSCVGLILWNPQIYSAVERCNKL